MEIPEDIQEQLKKGIEKFCHSLPQKPEELYEPVRYMLSAGGKNIRPALLLLTCKMF